MSYSTHQYAKGNPIERCAECGAGKAAHQQRRTYACSEWRAVKRTAAETAAAKVVIKARQRWARKSRPDWTVTVVAYDPETAEVTYETRGGVGIAGFRRWVSDEKFVRLFTLVDDPSPSPVRPRFDASSVGGAFDGFMVTSDADSGL